MQVVDGLEAIREIRTQEKAITTFRTAKIFVPTAHSYMENIGAATEGRFDAYLIEPIDTEKLLARLKAIGMVALRASRPSPARRATAWFTGEHRLLSLRVASEECAPLLFKQGIQLSC